MRTDYIYGPITPPPPGPSPGTQGPQGYQGPQGFQGPQGINGVLGGDGPQGFQGPQGNDGDPGGPQGEQGSPGAQGEQGFQGESGATGGDGPQGEPSMVPGPQGSQGSQGVQGINGIIGGDGPQGPQGFQGESGSQGSQGNQGFQGFQGFQGESGSQGLQGLGVQGPQGLQGTQGSSSGAYVASFDNSDLVSSILSVNHNLSNRYVAVQIFDENDVAVFPASIDTLTTNTLTVDLTGFTPISGTWHIVVVGGAAGGPQGLQGTQGSNGIPGGSDTEIQYNSSGSFEGSNKLKYDAATGMMSLAAINAQTESLLELQSNSGTPQSVFDKDGFGFIRTITFILGAGVSITTGTNKTNQIAIERDGKIVKCFANAKTGPTGDDAIFDINVNGTSIWDSNQSNRIKIADGNTTGTQVNFDTISVSEGDLFSIDIDQIGGTIPGQDIAVQLLFLLRNQ